MYLPVIAACSRTQSDEGDCNSGATNTKLRTAKKVLNTTATSSNVSMTDFSNTNNNSSNKSISSNIKNTNNKSITEIDESNFNINNNNINDNNNNINIINATQTTNINSKNNISNARKRSLILNTTNTTETSTTFSSRTPELSYSTAGSSYSGLKFGYEPQTNNTSALSSTAVPNSTLSLASVSVPSNTVHKDSPASSPGSEMGRKRTRNMSSASATAAAAANVAAAAAASAANVAAVAAVSAGTSGTNSKQSKLECTTQSSVNVPLPNPMDIKNQKLYQNGMVHASHMLGNHLNPNSSVAQKMTDQLNMEIEANNAFVTQQVSDNSSSIVGPQFPGKQTVNEPKRDINSKLRV